MRAKARPGSALIEVLVALVLLDISGVAMVTLLGQTGISSVFFDNCVYCPGCSLEDLGASFGKFLGALKYTDGTPVAQVDVVVELLRETVGQR